VAAIVDYGSNGRLEVEGVLAKQLQTSPSHLVTQTRHQTDPLQTRKITTVTTTTTTPAPNPE